MKANLLATQSALPRSVWFFVIALYVACVAACVLTRDFGFYFDDKIHVGALRVTFESGVPLPRTYHYPSFSYLVSLLAALPSWAAHSFDRSAFAAELSEALQRGLTNPPSVVLHARAVMASLSLLAVIWTALLAWRLSHSSLATCVAALTFALSFEFHYHARIWSPDALMAQFVVLSVLCAHIYLKSARRRDLVFAAVTAGLAAGTKFPGALALTAVGVAALAVEWRRAPEHRMQALWRTLRSCALAFGVLAIVFVLTTLGVLFDTERMRLDIAMELRHYRGEGQAGAHGPYAVEAGWEHFSRLIVYLTSQALSYSPPVALLLFAFGVVGAVHLVRHDRLGATVLFAVPALYIAYFSFQRLMVVRNFQVLVPFLAIAVGLGVDALNELRIPRPVRAGILLAVTLPLIWNLQFLVRADRSIVDRRRIDFSASLQEFVRSSGEPLFLAPHARELANLPPDLAQTAGNIVPDPRKAQYAIVLPRDLADLAARPGFSIHDLRANWPRLYEPLPPGPWEINYSYYPSWKGDPRPLRITAEYYRALSGEK